MLAVCVTGQAADPPGHFVELTRMDPEILTEIRYAGKNNFVKEKMYPCARCFLRKEVAEAIVKAQKILRKKGLGLKIWDAYRPLSVQYKLWKKMPDARFVMNPKTGSMHNRGAAVDLTIVDIEGNELDMGTPYDFFGEKAYHSYIKLPENILRNRRLLKETMAAVGFKSIQTEWWHYSYTGKNYALSNWEWGCP